jgi:hypothetical protein
MTVDELHGEQNQPSLTPPPRGDNKGVVLLLIGGVAILAVAAFIYFGRRQEARAPAPAEPVTETTYAAPTPLVTAPSRPLTERISDAGTAEETVASQKKNQHGGASERLGTIDTAAVNQFVNARFSQVRACYERRLKMNPFLEGDLDLSISIASSGKPTAIAVNADSIRDAQILDCVRRTIRGWTFPKPTGGRAVIAKNFKFKRKS